MCIFYELLNPWNLYFIVVNASIFGIYVEKYLHLQLFRPTILDNEDQTHTITSMDTNPLVSARTSEEWEGEFGISLQRLRIIRKMTQVELAKASNISLSTIQNLESGKGSTVRSMIAVVRALGKTDWLDAIKPLAPKISPMELLRQREAAGPPKRPYKRKTIQS